MPPSSTPGAARPLALYALLVCALAVVAAVVSFGRGSWLGVVWVLMAGVASNMAWYYLRRARVGRTAVAVPPTASCAGSGAGSGAGTATGTDAGTPAATSAGTGGGTGRENISGE